MSKYLVIAVDGPSCSGKSTIAKKLASRLGFVHLNSGALYRAVGLLALRSGIDLKSFGAKSSGSSGMKSSGVQTLELCRQLADIARSTNFEFRVEPVSNRPQGGSGVGQTQLWINGVDEEPNLYTSEVSQAASFVAVFAEVREVLTEVQREVATRQAVVLEGRDAGSVVFPQTPYKYYLDAELEVRAKRRLAQLEARGEQGLTLAQVTAEMQSRDHRDMTRSEAPLSKIGDAKIIDTTTLSEEEVIERIVRDVLSSR